MARDEAHARNGQPEEAAAELSRWMGRSEPGLGGMAGRGSCIGRGPEV